MMQNNTTKNKIFNRTALGFVKRSRGKDWAVEASLALLCCPASSHDK